jgi:hypothetical protein
MRERMSCGCYKCGAVPVTVEDKQISDLLHGLKDSRLVAVSRFIEMVLLAFLSLSGMEICNLCVLFVNHYHGVGSQSSRCDVYAACMGKCDCQAQEWIILKLIPWNSSC